MKKAPLVMIGTVAGLLGVIGFHSATSTTSLVITPGTAKPGSRAAGPASGNHDGSGPSSPATTASGALTSAIGSVVQYGYGELAVKVTVEGGKITAVSVPTLQTAEQYSQQLAAQAIPMLDSEVLSAQSAQINGISGATYTAQAYVDSLQAALDSLSFK
jgi:uncharacterized protein with FMN-binding domain